MTLSIAILEATGGMRSRSVEMLSVMTARNSAKRVTAQQGEELFEKCEEAACAFTGQLSAARHAIVAGGLFSPRLRRVYACERSLRGRRGIFGCSNVGDSYS